MKNSAKRLRLQEDSPLQDLILFCIFNVQSKEDVCAFERLTKECFSAFQKSFGLKTYTQWPDTRKLDRTLRSLRSKKLITGDPKTSFALTEQGKREVGEMLKDFRQKKLL